MAFSLTIVKLENALEQKGCPVCRLEQEAATESIDAFLWENVNDPFVRKPINDAYGFCPLHTQMLVTKEMISSGPMLGINMIYELLAKNVSRDLKNLDRKQSGHHFIRTVLAKIGIHLTPPPKTGILEPKGRCPVCDLTDQFVKNILATLFEELETQGGVIYETYPSSNGICLNHLRIGLMHYGEQFPKAREFLIEDTVRRLEKQRADMLEYIRKHNWQYRDEKLTQAEQVAWMRTLTFFTGLPSDKFTSGGFPNH